jgi:regulator of protease activity HflC (stomatin/prohibitin superfamily)
MDVTTPFTVFLLIVIGVILLRSVRIVNEYERGVVFRLGRVSP